MKLTKKQAINLSLKKWDINRKAGINNYYELERLYSTRILKLKASCGLCEYYCKKNEICSASCILNRLWGINCLDKKSLYAKWRYAGTKKEIKEYAEQIYQDILKLRRGL